MHPIVLYSGYDNDIRMTAGVPLAIPALLSAAVYLPFVDRLGNKKTAFIKALANFIGGLNGMDVSAVVPS